MKIQWKFLVLSLSSALILVIVSLIGYYSASKGLELNIESELSTTVQDQALQLDAWIREKASYAYAAATLMKARNGQMSTAEMQQTLRLAEGDKDILHLLNGNENGDFVSSDEGDATGRIDPKSRPWYQLAKSTGKLAVTEPYTSALNGKIVRALVVPYTNANGQFEGAICEPIELSILDNLVKNLTYHGTGSAIIIDSSGMIVASSDGSENIQPISEHPTLSAHFDAMKNTQKGYFFVRGTNGDELFAYASVPSTGTLIGIFVPRSEVFASLTRLRVTYIILTLLGLGGSLFLSYRLCRDLVRRVDVARLAAEVMSSGDLHMPDLDDDDKDEIGELSRSFDKMKHELKNLIQKTTDSSEQVASSAEELTATTHQSAEASASVAQSVVQIASGLENATKHMGHMVQEVEHVSKHVEEVAQKTNTAANFAESTEADAKQGAVLMQQALHNMGKIEKAAGGTTQVVQKLGESSQRIGEIVDAISMIAKQTNLLSLNAAIEAARAGEAGKGFAVVADEVRKLAAQSEKSAEEIRDRIAIIQKDTQDAVQTMEAGAESIHQGTGAIREVGTQFQGILQKVGSIRVQVDRIDETMSTLAKAAGRIVHGVESIDQITKDAAAQVQSVSAATEEQNSSAEEIASFSKSLAQMAMDMQGETRRFKL